MSSHRWAPAWWRRADVVVRDLPLALVLAIASVVPGVRESHGTRVGNLADRPFDAVAVALVLLQFAPLAVRRRWPAVCLAIVTAAFAVDQLRGYHTVAGVALPIALFSAGASLERRRRTAVAVLTGAYVLFVVAIDRLRASEPFEEYVTLYVLLAVAWCVGAWLRGTRAAEAERRALVAANALAAERTRIAGELHDVVTHHVTAMVVQAEAARYLTSEPERLDRALDAVTGTGREAIADLRQLLDLLDPGHDPGTGAGPVPTGPVPTGPVPTGLGDLRSLVERARAAGQPVELTEAGPLRQSPDGATAEAAAYRVVQECLTNALKHAPGSPTSVDVRRGPETITVEVRTRGTSRQRVPVGGSGRGLDGLGGRVGLLGGELVAGPQPDGDFLVRASIPAGGTA